MIEEREGVRGSEGDRAKRRKEWRKIIKLAPKLGCEHLVVTPLTKNTVISLYMYMLHVLCGNTGAGSCI